MPHIIIANYDVMKLEKKKAIYSLGSRKWLACVSGIAGTSVAA